MTESQEPLASHDPSKTDDDEVHNGSQAFGFFHRHQKLIIYTAGVFTLLTFSVTGALLGTTDRLFGTGYKGVKLTIPGGGDVQITQDDIETAKGISRVRGAGLRLFVFPPMSFGEEGDTNYIDQLAALHVAAVKAGVDASMDDAEAAIQAAVATYPNVDKAEQLAFAARTPDLDQFRKWVRNSLRVGNFIRLNALAVDRTDEAVVESILEDNEQLTFDVVYLDAKAYKESLKKDLNDEKLKEYLSGLEDAKAERFRKPAKRTALKVAMLDLETFNHEEFLGKELDKDLKIEDAAVQNRYISDRELRYKLPAKKVETPADPDKVPGGEKVPSPGTKPGDAGTKPDGGTKKEPDPKKGEETKKDPEKKNDPKDDESKGNGSSDPLASLQDPPPAGKTGEQGDPKAGETGEKGKAADAKAAAGEPQNKAPAEDPPPPVIGADDQAKQDAATADAQDNASDNYRKLDDALRKRIRSGLYAERVLAKWQASIDQELAQFMEAVINEAAAAEIALEDAKAAEVEAQTELDKKSGDAELEKKHQAAEAAVKAAKEALKAMKTKVDTRRKSFDLAAAVNKLAAGRKGLRIIEIAEMKNADELGKLDELGKWQNSHLPGQMTLPGEIHQGQVQNTEKGPFLFQVTEIEERQFKDFDKIKTDVETAYLKEKSEEYVKDKKETFEKTLEKLSRAKLADEIAKIEKEGKDEVTEKFGEWKSKLEGDLGKVEASLKELDPNRRSYRLLAKSRDALKAKLEKADEEKKSITETVEEQTKEKVEKKLAEVHKDLMAEAAKVAGFTVETVGPLSRKLNSEPRFKERYSNVIQAVFGDGTIAGFKETETSELKEDALNEVTFMASCKKIQEGSIANISRRQWLSERNGAGGGSFAGDRMQTALNQSFTMDAMRKAYGWVEPKNDDKTKDGAPSQGAADEKKDEKKSEEKKSETPPK